MGYVYGNRESTFGEGRLSLYFAAMHSKEAADGRFCRYLGRDCRRQLLQMKTGELPFIMCCTGLLEEADVKNV